ncbi:hypothetical protein F5878DRAFT_205316 [Lentinula raphanica]|uniref:Uncharacterized protein n=1 Tax=Lentinula raphanica TaxID=153919 RepID=A0AA38P7B5_9AGAR|nr:hypothetical protein F5878DRAFT_205316 [Lentinula raphanica]
MRPNAINLLSLALSLLMVSTRAIPVQTDDQVPPSTNDLSVQSRVEVSNLGYGPGTRPFEYIAAGVKWTASQQQNWGFPVEFQVVQGSLNKYVSQRARKDGSFDYNVYLLSDQPHVLNPVKDCSLGQVRIKFNEKNPSNTEFMMTSWKKSTKGERVTIGHKNDGMMFYEDVDKNVWVVERGGNVAVEQQKAKKSGGECCVMM